MGDFFVCYRFITKCPKLWYSIFYEKYCKCVFGSTTVCWYVGNADTQYYYLKLIFLMSV